MSDDKTEPRSELEQPIWAILFSGSGSWPWDNGVTYAEAEMARQTAERHHPQTDFTITTFKAASRGRNA